MIFKNKTSQAVSNQSTEAWLANYDRAAAKQAKQKPLTPAEVEAQRLTRIAEQDATDRAKREAAATQAARIVADATTGKPHPYTTKKHLTDIPFLTGIGDDYHTRGKPVVIVPMFCDITGDLVNVERITPTKDKDGRNKFSLAGGRRNGAQHVIGNLSDETLIYCEGYATGALPYQATGLSAVVRFNTGNLAKSTPPETCKRLLIAVDHDKNGAGQKAARKLESRLARKRPDIEVIQMLPPRIGSDWADYSESEIRELWPFIKMRYLPDNCLDHGKVIIVKSQHGTGKSTAVRKQIAKHEKVLIVCAGIKQAQQEHKKNPGLEMYRNLAPGQIVADGAIVVIDSVQRIQRDFDLIVIDESEQISAAPLKPNLHAVKGDPKGRIHLYEHLAALMSRANKVILLDADAGELTNKLCEHAGLKPRIVENLHKSLTDASVDIIESKGEFLQQIQDCKTHKHIFCASKSDAIRLYKTNNKHCVLVTSDNKSNDFISLVSSGQQFTGDLISTTALRSGVSIDEGTHNMEPVFAWIRCGDKYPPLSDQIQAMRRARGVKKFVVYVETPPLHAKLTTDSGQIRKGVERGLHLNKNHIGLETYSAEKGAHLDPMTTDLFCLHRAELNRQRNNPKQWMIDRIEGLGATVTIDGEKKPLLDKIHRDKLKQAGEAIKGDAIQIAETVEIPDTLEDCKIDVERDLHTARYVLNYSEPLARETAKREINKPGFIKSIQRREWEIKPQSELIASDRVKVNSGDAVEIKKCSAKAAMMTQEVIGMCWHLLDGFSADTTEEILKPWLIRNASDYGNLTGRRFVCPEEIKTAGFLKKALERYGITVTARKSNGQRIYFVDRTDGLNQRALEQLTGTNCITNIVNTLSLTPKSAKAA